MTLDKLKTLQNPTRERFGSSRIARCFGWKYLAYDPEKGERVEIRHDQYQWLKELNGDYTV